MIYLCGNWNRYLKMKSKDEDKAKNSDIIPNQIKIRAKLSKLSFESISITAFEDDNILDIPSDCWILLFCKENTKM